MQSRTYENPLKNAALPFLVFFVPVQGARNGGQPGEQPLPQPSATRRFTIGMTRPGAFPCSRGRPVPLWTRGGASPNDRPRRTSLYRRRPGPGASATGPPQAVRPKLGNGTDPDQGDATGTAVGTHVRLPTPLRVIPTSPPGKRQYAWLPPVEAAAVSAEKTARHLAKLEAEDRAYHDRQLEAGAHRGGGSPGVDRS